MKRPSFFKLLTTFSLCLSVLLIGNLMANPHPENLPKPDGKPADMSKPVKVFILMGQSNMLGFGKVSGNKEGSLDFTVKNKKRFTHLMDANGKWTVRKDVRNVRVMCNGGGKVQEFNNEWHTVSGSAFGPEIALGHILGETIKEPVLILKSCIGNRALGWDLLPPGSVSYDFNGKTIPGYQGNADLALRPAKGWYAGKQYDSDLDGMKHVLNNLGKFYPGATEYEIAGFVWWQGHKDQNPQWASRYEQNLVQLIKALRQDFKSPKAKFVCATIGFGGTKMKGTTLQVAEAQLAVSDYNKYPEHQGNVKSVDVRKSWRGGGAHYGGHAETYIEVGHALGWAMADLIKEDVKNQIAVAKPVAKVNKKQKKNKKNQKDVFKGLEKQNFLLSALNTSRMMRTYSLKPGQSLNPQEKFLMAYFSKDWQQVSSMMSEMDEQTAIRVYSRIIHTLNNTREKPMITPSDIVKIMSLPGAKMDHSNMDRLSSIIKFSILPEEEFMLKQTFQKASSIGGKQGLDKNLIIGRVLLKAGFRGSVNSFFPTSKEAEKIKDRHFRDLVVNFHKEEAANSKVLVADIKKTLNKKYEVLLQKSGDKAAKETAMNNLVQYMYTLSPNVIKAITDAMLEHDKALAERFFVLALEKMAGTAQRDRTGANHSQNLYVLSDIAKVMEKQNIDTSVKPWNHIVDMMANVWLLEVDYTLSQWSNHLKRRNTHNYVMPFAKPNHLMATMPEGKWAKNLSADKVNRLNLKLPKIVLISSEPEVAIKLILELAKKDTKAATILGQEFINKWAEVHNPDIPAHILRHHKQPEGTSIVVTPIMIRRNISELAKIMKLLRDNNVAPSDSKSLVAAFGACYGNAEVYKLKDIEEVFGPIQTMSSDVFSALINDMAVSLGERWRDMANQKRAVTSRRQADLLEMVREGYGHVVKMVEKRLESHPTDWLSMSSCATLLSDWGDYEYFQNLTKSSENERMDRYKEKNNLAYSYFHRAAETYVEQAKKAGGIDNKVFMAWFNSLLGFNSNGEINLSKAMNREVLEQMRDIIRSLPESKAQMHVDQFAKYIDQKLEDKKNPMPAELKYKFLASALIITKSSPFSMENEKQVEYYQELLKEVRLQTRVDGSNTIWRKEDFGIVISLVHSDVMGDLIDFEKYLKFKGAAAPPTGRRNQKPKSKILQMTSTKNARNEFERKIMESLNTFFDIKSITFSPTNVEPRKIEKPGWSETVLAYVQVRALGVSVDRIPPIELDLDYFDLSGPITIPVTSSESVLQLKEKKTSPRPVSNVEITQTLDTRQLFANGKLKLDVVAKGVGLMPDLEEIVDLTPLKNSIQIEKIEQTAGPLVEQLNSYTKDVHVTSVREWSVILDKKAIEKTEDVMNVFFPTSKSDDIIVRNETYKDVEIVSVIGDKVIISKSGTEGMDENGNPIVANTSNIGTWASIGIAVLLFVIVLFVVINKLENKEEGVVKASDVFKMPEAIDPFVAVRLLRSLSRSDLVSLNQQQLDDIQKEIKEIESMCFDPNNQNLNETELKNTVSKWLKLTC